MPHDCWCQSLHSCPVTIWGHVPGRDALVWSEEWCEWSDNASFHHCCFVLVRVYLFYFEPLFCFVFAIPGATLIYVLFPSPKHYNGPCCHPEAMVAEWHCWPITGASRRITIAHTTYCSKVAIWVNASTSLHGVASFFLHAVCLALCVYSL